MPTLIEQNIGRVWAAKQTAKGTPATVASRSFKQVGGNTVVNVNTSSENYSDGTKYGAFSQALDNIQGQGQPVLQSSVDDLAWWLWIFHGAETVTPSGTNAVQTIATTGTPTGGTFTLTFEGRTTAPIAFNATAAVVQAALEALPNIGTGNVLGGGGPLPTGVTLTFQNALAKRPIAPLTANSAGLTGGASPTATVAQTTPGVLAVHTFTPSTTSAGFWFTWWQTLGLNTQDRKKFNDCRAGGLQGEASSGTKQLHVTPNMLSLDPGEVYTTDPTPALTAQDPLFWTEGQGTFTLDGNVTVGASQFQMAFDEALTPAYGDSPVPFDLARGNAGATITVAQAADSDFIAWWNTKMYGTAAPTAGQKPLLRVPPSGSYSLNLQKKDSASNVIGSFNGTFPNVLWQIPDSPGLTPDSGTSTISLTGQLTRPTLNPTAALYTLAVGCQQAAFVS
jgi:hypothetical protein